MVIKRSVLGMFARVSRRLAKVSQMLEFIRVASHSLEESCAIFFMTTKISLAYYREMLLSVAFTLWTPKTSSTSCFHY